MYQHNTQNNKVKEFPVAHLKTFRFCFWEALQEKFQKFKKNLVTHQIIIKQKQQAICL
jgi:hypothetical protein